MRLPFNPLAHPVLWAAPERLSAIPAWHEHLPFAMFLVSTHRPRTLVELGAMAGDSYCAFCQAIKTLGLTSSCYAVDTWQEDEQSGFYGAEVLADLRAHHDSRYGSFSQLVQSTFDEALTRLPDNSIDLLHLNGRRTYEAVKHDFESWQPKLSQRALVLFDDINVRARDCGAHQYWAELRQRYPHFEFLHGQGLGVLAVGEVTAPELRALFVADAEQTSTVREFFFRLGRAVSLEGSNRRDTPRLAEMERALTAQQSLLTAAQQDLITAQQDVITARQDAADQQRAAQAKIKQITRQLRAQEETRRALEAQTQELERALAWLTEELRLATSGRGWGLLQWLWRVRRWLAPRNSRRAQALHLGWRAWRVWRQEGNLAARLKVVRKLRRRSGAHSNEADPATTDAYQIWIAEHEPRAAELKQQRRQAAQFSYQPLISVITPVYNPPPHILRATITSVRAQTYENWELCLADGGSSDPEVRGLLKDLARSDRRIKVKLLEQNLGISGNSNEALALATGEYVALLDHDDLLAPNAFFEVVKRLNDAGAADFIYFDEDHISEDGKVRQHPFFKPDWSPELLLAANYLTHCVIRRQLVLDAGGFDPQTDGAQDWDLFFRCTERTKLIAHIPKVLYHWRQLRGSTAAAFDAKPYVFQAQQRAVETHLQRRGIAQPRATSVNNGRLRVTWPTPAAKVSIIIPTKDKVEYLRKCITSITELTDYPDLEILLVDNDSCEEATWDYYDELSADARIRRIDYRAQFNYSTANNLGAAQASGEFLLFLNNDTEALAADWIDELVRWAALPEIGAVGAKLLYPDDTIQHAGVVMGIEGHASHVFWGMPEGAYGPFGSVEWYRNYMAVTGACLMMRRAVFDEIGGFDEGYLLAFSDVEICLRAVKHGYRVVYTPFARLRHYEGRSRGAHIPAADIKLGYDHMKEIVEAGDPYFNPNLSYGARVPTIIRPGEVSRAEWLRKLLPVEDGQLQ